ncbi:MAG: MarR family transcriptional regulator [Burkholderiaceae bacterium]|nr:MarR family transcriptional regulator [Burkholderiaceae bacterium]MCD6672016.1 MarR family transcriptional regulator [Burkholderiaceae bacterium]
MPDAKHKKVKRPVARSSAGDRNRESLRLGRFFPYHLAITADIVSGELAAALHHATKLSMTEWRIMAVIGSFAPLSTKTVAAYTTINKVRVSRAVSRLVQLGYVTREIDPVDNRLLKLDFSTRGRAIFDVISSVATAWEDALLESFSDKEIDTIVGALARLRARVGELAPARRKAKARLPDELGAPMLTRSRRDRESG